MSEQEELFRELHGHVEEEDFDDALGVCDKILKASPGDEDAIKTKVYCHLSNDEWGAAISTIDSQAKSLRFERAYALYRQADYRSSLKELDAIPDSAAEVGVAHLRGQCYYKMKNFQDAAKIYENLALNDKQLSTSTPEEEEKEVLEYRTNLLSAYVSSDQCTKATQQMNAWGNQKTSYEIVYNAACAILATGQLETALSKLSSAKELCETSMQADEAEDEEIFDEVAIIDVQRAFAMQLQGFKQQALELYSQVLSKSPGDQAVVATASNNIVALRTQDEKLFDSTKRLERCAKVPLKKLSDRQIQAIQLNRCLVLFYGKKYEECHKLIQELQKTYPDSEFLILVKANLFFRQKQTKQSEEVFANALKKHPASLKIASAFANILLLQGKTLEASQVLRGLPPAQRHQPAVVAVVASLIGEEKAACDFIATAAKFWESQEKTAEQRSNLSVLRIELASLYARIGDTPAASNTLNDLYALYTKDQNNLRPEVACNLLMAAQKCGVAELASKVGAQLPELERLDSGEVDKLENANIRSERRKQRLEVTASTEEKTNANSTKKPKKNRKRKPRLPKGFDPSNPGPMPDPERWLPAWERTSASKKNKKKKSKKGLGRGGAQGGLSKEGMDKLQMEDPDDFKEKVPDKVQPAAVDRKAAQQAKAASSKNNRKKNRKKRGK